MRWLLVVLIVLPFVELYLLVAIGHSIGLWPTVALIVVPALLGFYVAKIEGLRVWRSYQEALAQGRLPDEGILGALLVLVGGVLLIIPGVLTDLAGILLLIPFTRKLVAGVIRRRIEQRLGQGLLTVVGPGGPFGGPDIEEPLDGQAEVIDPSYGESGGWDGGEVVDTEGVEVQSTNLLPSGPDEPGSGGRGSGGQES